MADKKDKCEHVSCICTAAKDSDYCSAYCEGKGSTADVTCGCGHSGCSPVPTSGPAR